MSTAHLQSDQAPDSVSKPPSAPPAASGCHSPLATTQRQAAAWLCGLALQPHSAPPVSCRCLHYLHLLTHCPSLPTPHQLPPNFLQLRSVPPLTPRLTLPVPAPTPAVTFSSCPLLPPFSPISAPPHQHSATAHLCPHQLPAASRSAKRSSVYTGSSCSSGACTASPVCLLRLTPPAAPLPAADPKLLLQLLLQRLPSQLWHFTPTSSVA